MRVDPSRVGRISFVSALALLLASCSGSTNSATPSPTPNTASSMVVTVTTSIGDAAHRQAIDAYNAMWRDVAAVELTADYRSSRLAQHAAGDALSLLVQGVYVNLRHGIVARGEPRTRPTVTELVPKGRPTAATIADCFDDSHWLNYVASTGHLQNNTPGGPHRTTATVSKVDGTWKVTALQVGAVGTC